MDKYATYRVFKNTQTGEIRRYLMDDEINNELEKIAESTEWEELDEDPG